MADITLEQGFKIGLFTIDPMDEIKDERGNNGDEHLESLSYAEDCNKKYVRMPTGRFCDVCRKVFNSTPDWTDEHLTKCEECSKEVI